MPKWLSSIGRKDAVETPKTVLELMVLEGADAGQQFTVDGAEVRIGRGKPKTGQTGAILLYETSVSAWQATIRAERDGSILVHNRDATNPTLVNGRKITKQKIMPGDRIQMGLCQIEVRQRQGIALSGLFEVHDASTEALSVTETLSPVSGQTAGTQLIDDEDVTVKMPRVSEGELPTPVENRGVLVLLRGVPGLENESYPLRVDATLIGRSSECEVTVPEPGISRRHVRCEWQGDDLFLFHLSETNSTCVNGTPVTTRRKLSDGDELLLADQVVIRVDLGDSARDRPSTEDPPTLAPESARPPSLRRIMEEKIERDRLIEEQFAVEGSFVDIDVVGSYKMKRKADRPAHIIVSFERFRSFVESIIEEFGGLVLNSNGDELMCFFESTHDAVRSASAIFGRLDEFNAKENVLSSPFRFRIGIHTGRSLVDRKRGIAYSEVLDIAGHLQKEADENGLLISRVTLDALPGGLGFEPAGILEREGIETFRATSPID